jgi:hypothetical protein
LWGRSERRGGEFGGSHVGNSAGVVSGSRVEREGVFVDHSRFLSL